MLEVDLYQVGGLDRPSFFFVLLVASLLLAALILWRRYRSRRALMQRVVELEVLSDAGRSLVSSTLDVRALCKLIAREAAKVIDTSTFQVGLFEGAFYRIEYWQVEGLIQETPRFFDLARDGGLVGWVKRSQKPILIRDFRKEMDHLPARPSYVSDSPPISALFLPLISGQETVGIMAAQSNRRNAFDNHDLRLLSVIANQAGAAVANARLYQEEKQRASHLELVGQIAGQINALTDMDELLQQAVNLTRDTFGYLNVAVYTTTDVGQAAVLQAATDKVSAEASARFSAGEGLVGRALSTKETTIVHRANARRLVDTLESEHAQPAQIAIPLIVDAELLGVFQAASNEPGAFSDQEQKVLEALAAQVAIALYKALQLRRQKEQTWLTTAQLQATAALQQSTDIESLADALVRLIPILSGEKRCALLLWEEEYQTYRGLAQYGYQTEGENSFSELRLSQGHWKTLDAVHVGQEMRTASGSLPWRVPNEDGQRVPGREMLFPLVAQSRTVGALVTGNDLPVEQSIDERRAELLGNIATQTSQAIGAIQLLLAQQEEAWVNTALLQVAEAVNQLTDLNEILGTIVRLLPMLVGVRTCVILIRDDESGTYHAGPGHGISEMGQGLLESFEVDLSEFPLLGEQDVERVGPDASYYTFQLPHWMYAVMGADKADIFPLFSRARLVGVLVVGPTENGLPLSGRRLNIVTGIAQQAAIAVTNDRLYQESAERNRIEKELDVARSIQTSFLPERDPSVPGCSIASYWRAARQVSGDFYDFLPLPGGRLGIAIADVADKGVPAALFMALSRTILRTIGFNRQNPSDVLRRANELIVADSKSDLFVTVFYAIWDPAASILTYANAGHNPPILVTRDGKTKLLRGKGIALGILPEVEISQEELTISLGEAVVFYTDGVTEAMNEDLDEFGMERLRLATSGSRSGQAGEIIRAITEAVASHAGDTPQFDDITMVVLKRQDSL